MHLNCHWNYGRYDNSFLEFTRLIFFKELSSPLVCPYDVIIFLKEQTSGTKVAFRMPQTVSQAFTVIVLGMALDVECREEPVKSLGTVVFVY